MRYELRMNAYDCLDRIVVSVSVRGSSELTFAPDGWVTLASGSVAGVGEEEVRVWARDALIAAVEAL